MQVTEVSLYKKNVKNKKLNFRQKGQFLSCPLNSYIMTRVNSKIKFSKRFKYLKPQREAFLSTAIYLLVSLTSISKPGIQQLIL